MAMARRQRLDEHLGKQTVARRWGTMRVAWAWGIGLLITAAGCQPLAPKPPVNYQTLAVDTEHDTSLAKKEHAHAVKLMYRHSAGKHANLEKAEQHLQRALVADVTYGPAHNSLGILYYWKRSLYLAAWEFEYAAKLMPDRTEPSFNLALVYERADNFDRAISYYEETLAKHPHDSRAMGGLARARFRQGGALEEIRPLLEQLLFYETRPAWIAWAKSQLGANPLTVDAPDAAPVEAGPELIPPGPEDLDGAPKHPLADSAPLETELVPAPEPLLDAPVKDE
jgi:tetratricopeptide (TPR) repeat protein